MLSGAYSLAGREEEARSEAAQVLRHNPKYSLNFRRNTLPFKKKEDLQQYYIALQKAGLPGPSDLIPGTR